MENFARVVFTIIFITILAGVIVAFGLFAVAPAEKIVKVFTGDVSSSEEENTALSEALSEVISDIVSRALPTSTPSGTSNESGFSGGSAAIPTVPEPGTPENPQQSAPITESQVPKNALVITMTAAGIEPSGFSVAPNEDITLAVTSNDDQTHVFKFESATLRNVAVGVGPGETRSIRFYTPETSGEYVFYCDVPGHRGRGEEGVMVVQ